MKYLAAYLLLNAAGNAKPSASDISNVLSSVGVEVEKDRLDALLKEVSEKDISELITEGSSKLASVPTGGAAAAGGAASGGAAAKDAPAEEAKEEEKEEESDGDMGMGLFD